MGWCTVTASSMTPDWPFKTKNAVTDAAPPTPVAAHPFGEEGSSDWRSGWIVFANRDRDDPPERDSGEDVITSSGGWPGGSITCID